jgi:hypothetical protein
MRYALPSGGAGDSFEVADESAETHPSNQGLDDAAARL